MLYKTKEPPLITTNYEGKIQYHFKKLKKIGNNYNEDIVIIEDD